MNEVRALVETAIEAAALASQVCRSVQQRTVLKGVDQAKTGDEPVTIADYASQALILRAIAARFPRVAILSEEASSHLRDQQSAESLEEVRALVADVLGERVGHETLCDWIDHQGDRSNPLCLAIDPIDGTKGFLRREQYAIAVGVLDRGEPVGGVLACPNLPVDGERPDGPRGAIFHAVKGEGAFQRPLDLKGGDRRIRVAPTTDPAKVRVLCSVESSHGDPRVITDLIAELRFGGGPVRIDSQVKYAVLARGGAEVYLRPRSKPSWRDNVWDHAAGVAIAREAGGRATDQDGARLDFSCAQRLENNRGVLTTNSALHDSIVDALRRIESRA